MKSYKANVSLTTVLVTSTILLLGSISVILNIVDMAKNAKNNVFFELNKIRANSCIEESMSRIKFNPNFEGSVTITFSDGSCESTVTKDPVDLNLRLLNVIAITEDYHYSVSKKANISQTPFYIYN